MKSASRPASHQVHSALPAATRRASLGRLPKRSQAIQCGHEPRQQSQARLRERQARIEAPDQLSPQVFLKPAHPVTHGTLGEAQLLGSACEAQVAGHGFEGNQFCKRW